MTLTKTEQKTFDRCKKLINEVTTAFEKAGRSKISKQFAKYGDLVLRQFKEPGKRLSSAGVRVGCGLEGCPDFAEAKGYCRKHYQYRRRFAKANKGKAPAGWIENPKPGSVKVQ